MAFAAAQAADDKKGTQILVLEVGRVSILADYFVIATGLSGAQIRAIASGVEEKLKTEFERLPIRVEGLGEAGWVLADYGEVIIHVFLPKEREFYQLEAFWGHAPRLDLSEVLPVS
ncbi:MAG: ribosome silencing factor [Gemmatimonadaceae bacterium]|nr:ribosome silencing factor [Gloeobacterales cyanobacterium ES-bin-141]